MKGLFAYVLLIMVISFPAALEVGNDYSRFMEYAHTTYPWMSEERCEVIYQVASHENVDPWAIAAIIDAESRGTRRAVSCSGARGMMQIMPFWVSNPRRLFNEQYNIRLGTRIFKNYLKRAKGNMVRALKFYERGPGGSGYNWPYIYRIMTKARYWSSHVKADGILARR